MPSFTITNQVLYVEAQHEIPFDWNTFLAQDNIDPEDWDYAEEEAASWVTCACGNQCAVLPRDSAGEPLDKQLAVLGTDFYRNVGHNNASLTRLTLAAIERRSAYLLTLPNYTDLT